MSPYDYIKKEIILAHLEAGSVFDEQEVAKQLNVSRTPVREAVLRLASEGYLTIIPRKGTLVSNISLRDIKEVYEFRIILECASINEIKYIDKSKLEYWLNYFNEAILKAQNLNEYSTDELENEDSDKLFHEDIISFLDNKLVSKEITLLMDKSARIRYTSNINNINRYIESLKEHIAIIEALIRDDKASAQNLMKEHLLSSLRGYNL